MKKIITWSLVGALVLIIFLSFGFNVWIVFSNYKLKLQQNATNLAVYQIGTTVREKKEIELPFYTKDEKGVTQNGTITIIEKPYDVQK